MKLIVASAVPAERLAPTATGIDIIHAIVEDANITDEAAVNMKPRLILVMEDDDTKADLLAKADDLRQTHEDLVIEYDLDGTFLAKATAVSELMETLGSG